MAEGEDQSWEALWAMLNIPSDYYIVDVIKLELGIWEQVLNRHSPLQFFRFGFFLSEKMLNLFEMYTEISLE